LFFPNFFRVCIFGESPSCLTFLDFFFKWTFAWFYRNLFALPESLIQSRALNSVLHTKTVDNCTIYQSCFKFWTIQFPVESPFWRKAVCVVFDWKKNQMMSTSRISVCVQGQIFKITNFNSKKFDNTFILISVKKSIKTKTSPLADIDPKLHGFAINYPKIYLAAPF
jgi:hypothetical protein